MQYSVAHLTYTFAEEWQQQLFEQTMCDMGFEVFDQADAYIQTHLLSEIKDDIERLIAQTDGVNLIGWEDCPDQNWNAQWEAEHEAVELPMGVHITPHCAFGAGHHETTGMMVQALMEAAADNLIQDAQVLDMGCGTGVLGIMAKKLGAAQVLAVDIDDKSVDSTIANAADNGVQLAVRLGDTPPPGQYHLILANIHRNILVAHMPKYAEYLLEGGELWLSGFYQEDIPYLTQAAAAVALQHIETRNRNEWQWLRFKK